MKTQKKKEVNPQLIIQAAKRENDIRRLLRPFYSYRLFIKFIKPISLQDGTKQYSSHFYGFEENCTYNQCYHGHFQNIVLNKLQGYKHCIEMAEEKYKGKYHHATIYSRSHFPGGVFTTEHRHYDSNGEIVRCQDPVISESDQKILYFSIVGGFLLVHENEAVQVDELLSSHLDWKNEVASKL